MKGFALGLALKQRPNATWKLFKNKQQQQQQQQRKQLFILSPEVKRHETFKPPFLV